MAIFMEGFEWSQQCVVAYVIYDAYDELGALDSPSQCEWIVPGTVEDKC